MDSPSALHGMRTSIPPEAEIAAAGSASSPPHEPSSRAGEPLPIRLDDITPELARESGFKGVVDLLKVAKHGRGENVYLVRFHYIPPAKARRA